MRNQWILSSRGGARKWYTHTGGTDAGLPSSHSETQPYTGFSLYFPPSLPTSAGLGARICLIQEELCSL